VLIVVALVLLFVLPGPWSWIAFVGVTLLWLVELYGWNRTVRHRRRVVGAETLIGERAVVTAPCRPLGQVRLRGETWEARCEAGAATGATVRVIGRDELTLVVEPVNGQGN
jgi:membrane protein implicated in regulation of membrane protease activity